MLSLRTVLCPVDFSPATARQVAVATDLCRAFDATLVLHHNRGAAGTGASVGWMWQAGHVTLDGPAIDAHMASLIDSLPSDVRTEARVTTGLSAQAVLAVSEAVDADLVVLSTHGATTDDHVSLTEQVLEHAKRPVLALHEPSVEHRTPRFGPASAWQVVVAPIDLTPGSLGSAEVAFELTRRLAVDLHLVHATGHPGRHEDPDAVASEARRRLAALVPFDLADRTSIHVDEGDAARAIVRIAGTLAASCIVMGGHSTSPLRRWFTRDHAKAVLHDAPCPVWYVPAATVRPSSREGSRDAAALRGEA